jgi:hypothetical protein
VENFSKFQRFWNGDAKTRQKIHYSMIFLGILGIFGGGKETLDHKYEKINLVDILLPQKYMHFCLTEDFSFFLHLGDN